MPLKLQQKNPGAILAPIQMTSHPSTSIVVPLGSNRSSLPSDEFFAAIVNEASGDLGSHSFSPINQILSEFLWSGHRMTFVCDSDDPRPVDTGRGHLETD